ncbi:MAG: TetR/AcrR family transcriptional regulator [Rhizobiaceae bacterium]|nr:TetR/AcrR family transcriptional regulator [Rhizobiaceae bacterium]
MSNTSPSARARFAALDDETRARWLDPAEREFSEFGFERASLNRIIADANESKGRTYHYFADKGEMFRATVERRLARAGTFDLGAEALVRLDRASYWLWIVDLCRRLTGVLQEDKRLAALLRILHQEAAAQRAFAEPLAQLRRQVEAVVAAGQSFGAVRGDLPLDLLADVAISLIVTVDNWFAMNATDLPEAEEARLSEKAFSLLMAPLLPPADHGKTET